MTGPESEAPLPPPPSPGDDEALLAAFVGPNWSSHYQGRFAALAAGARGGIQPNMAAVVAPMWLAWRGFWVLQFGANLLFIFVALALAATGDSEAGILIAVGVAYLALGALEGAGADHLVYRRARRALARIRARGLSGAEAAAAMRKAGGVSVVGVVVVPVVTFLAMDWATMFGHHHDDRGRAWIAAMRSDLRNLVTAQENYFADSARYSATLITDSGSAWRFHPSTGVTVTIGIVTGTGWNATATHHRSANVCGIFIGDAPAPVAGASEGEPKCEVPARRE